jgi:hypothetical protein
MKTKKISTDAVVAIIVVLAVSFYSIFIDNIFDESQKLTVLVRILLILCIGRLVFFPVFKPKKKLSETLSREEMIQKLLSLLDKNGNKRFGKDHFKYWLSDSVENIYNDYFLE